MVMRQLTALGLALGLAAAPATLMSAQSTTGLLAGTAKDEAKKPFGDYSVQARELEAGRLTGSMPLDKDANFVLKGLPAAKYVIELLDRNGKIVCTEGPFDLTQKLVKDDVVISCGHVPAAWWLLGAAGAAGVTAGVAAGATASPSR